MNAQLVPMPDPADELDDEVILASEETTPVKWEMKKLTPRHKQIAALVAQGMKLVEVAAITGVTPQYVSMLLRQALVKEYIAEMCEAVGTRMEALFAKTVDVIAETLDKGGPADRLKAARLQLEATKRIGRVDPNVGGNGSNVERLEKLAERLLFLQSGTRQGHTFNENGQEITEA